MSKERKPPAEEKAAEKPPAEERSAEAGAKASEDKLIEAVAHRAAEVAAQRVAELLRSEGPQDSRPPPKTLPLEAEEVEVVGEKVNYKVALNPEIFWRYNVFKAEAERRGRKWDGTFGDFLDMATKDILAVYGIHPTVLTMRGGKMMVELPVDVEEVEED